MGLLWQSEESFCDMISICRSQKPFGDLVGPISGQVPQLRKTCVHACCQLLDPAPKRMLIQVHPDLRPEAGSSLTATDSRGGRLGQPGTASDRRARHQSPVTYTGLQIARFLYTQQFNFFGTSTESLQPAAKPVTAAAMVDCGRGRRCTEMGQSRVRDRWSGVRTVVHWSPHIA